MFKHLFTFGCLGLLGLALYFMGDRRSTALPVDRKSLSPEQNSSGHSAHQPTDQDFTWKVERVSDGDTIAVTNNVDKLKIRFACMDAPEKKQPLGMDSKSALQGLIDQGGGKVALNIRDTDRYGRKVAEVWVQVGGQPMLVQEKMLQQGYAMVYHQYIADCQSSTVAIAAEGLAKSQRLGVWATPNYQPPWEYRKEQRGSK